MAACRAWKAPHPAEKSRPALRPSLKLEAMAVENRR
jgi:hypothetical protein